ncbi:hypothetical protein ACFLT2_02110 [Acidobacteriota bacterium]
MLKRYQVLLPEWLEDYLKWGVERSKVSFSEIIRLEVCLGVLATIEELHPEYKPGLALKDILSAIKSFAQQKPRKDKVSNFLSTIYFETRKAIEYRYSKTSGKLPTDSNLN